MAAAFSAGLALAGLAVSSVPAFAQMGGAGAMGGVGRSRGGGAIGGGGGDAGPGVPPPPPALPGAQPGQGAAPSQVPLSDLPPNEALFDGVNRGDIAAVRDALSRGADLNAVNVLGITATDLAVDLGRNDISFLLLSMRGASAASSRPKPEALPPDLLVTARPSPRQRQAPTRPAAAATDAGTRAVPKLFANDGGTPVPSAGFLGFDVGGR
ncbi:MAG: hypothetical protein AB7S57_02305 [Acetobacteraceae bacterium]